LGYRRATSGLAVDDALFQALQLFVLEGGTTPSGTPWELNIARFLAPAVLGYAAIQGILFVARDQFALWRTRLLARKHVVVIGLGDTGFTVAVQLRNARRRVVVCDPAGTGPRAAACRERGAVVLAGDIADTAILTRARPDRANDVVIAATSDSASIRSLAAVEVATRDARRPPAFHVELRSPDLWSELHSIGLAGADRVSRVEFFLVADRRARSLLAAASDGRPARTLLLQGEGVVIRRVAEHAARSALLDEREVAVVIVGPESARQQSDLRSTLPWLDRACDFAAARHVPEHPLAPVAAIVCGLPDAEAVAAGTDLERLCRGV